MSGGTAYGAIQGCPECSKAYIYWARFLVQWVSEESGFMDADNVYMPNCCYISHQQLP